MFTTARDRIAAATGAAFVVLIIIGNQISQSGTVQSTHPSGAQVLKNAAHQAGSASATAGFVLELLGFVAFMGFLGYLAGALRSRHLDRQASPVAAGTAILAGIIMLAVKLASVMPMGALVVDRKTLSPDIAQVLNDMNGYAFVVSWMPFAVFVGATAIALHRARLVGRPTLYIGALLGVGGLSLTFVGLQHPLDINPVGFMLGLLWVLVVSVRLAVKPGTTEAAPIHAASQDLVAVNA